MGPPGQFFTSLCVLLCFILPILGNRYGPGVIPLQGTWGGRILTLQLNYVAGYTCSLLFLFKWTHNCYVDNQGLAKCALAAPSCWQVQNWFGRSLIGESPK